MKFSYTILFPHWSLSPGILTFLALLSAGLSSNAYAQSQKSSKKEWRMAQIDSVFDRAESMGLDTKGMLRYEYYFSDPEKKQLEDLGGKLKKDSFEILSLVLRDDRKWLIRIMKNEILSKQMMYEREKKFRALIYRFLVDDFVGFSISPVEINPLLVREDKFVSFIHSLDNEALFHAATYLLNKQSFDRAKLAFQRCIDVHFKQDTSNFQLGNALVATNDLVKGIEHWEQARNLNPQYLEPFIKLGTIFFENSHFNRSLSNFQKADALKPDDDDILYNISKCLLQLERYNQSYEYAERARKINPKNKYVQGVLDILNQSEIKKLRKKYPDN